MDQDDGQTSREHQLRQAWSRQEYVRVERSIPGADEITGFVVGVGSRWVLLSVVFQGAPNGWVALALRDVAAVVPAPGGRFVRRGLESQSFRTAVAPDTQLALSAGAPDLLVTAAAHFPLVTFYVERSDPLSCIIGRPVAWTDERLEWQEMTVEAVWEDDPSSWLASDITRVDIGGQYEEALGRVARLGEPPVQWARSDPAGEEEVAD